jgi:hypothetical protein
MTQGIRDSYKHGVYEADFEDGDDDDIPSNPSTETPLADIIQQRLSRRTALKGLTGVAATAALGSTFLTGIGRAAAQASTLGFQEIAHDMTTGVQTAPGYSAELVIRWGDKVTADAPAFDVANQSGAAQNKQFGYNNDFMAYMPLPLGSGNSENGLLCVSHAYTNAHLMWSVGEKKGAAKQLNKAQMDVELAAHGHSVIEVKRTGGKWAVVEDSRYNRRFSLVDTEMRMSGPAAGHDRLKTNADPSGTKVIGTINNCAGGTTPWDTVLIAEENFHGYFTGDPKATSEARNYKRYGLKNKPRYQWGQHHDRFNIDKEPNEPNRFGWVVEIDPYDPASTPIKRTALGRFKHECATTIVNPDGRVTVYSGDDQRFDYLYKFVTEGRFQPGDREANRDLLDSGTLYVAKFAANGTMSWLPLVFGDGPLTAENGFHSHADVMIETRHAADLLGATPMDRPEDVETNPINGRTYVLCTNNTKRKPEQIDAANPRAKNKHGQIIELIPPGEGKNADHTATNYRWDFFLIGGNPNDPKDGAMYLKEVSKDGWVSTPDNCAFDAKGRIWITTDGQPKSGMADSVYAADTQGPGRGLTRCFFNAPTGAEICGPTFTPDQRTLFVAIQHPGDDKGSTFDDPSTRWPDFAQDMPPRPSVVAITKDDGGEIGT